MLIVLSGIGLSVVSIVVFLWLPGKLICSIGSNAHSRTTTDAFFAGWLWLVTVTIILSPFVRSSYDLALLVRLLSGVLAILFVITNLYKKFSKTGSNTIEPVKVGCITDKLLISLFVFVFLFSHVLTHNLGFDDVSNLQYIHRGLQENPFPIYRTLVGYWQAARYPAFGTLNVVLAQGITGGAFYIYYLLAFLLFANVLTKTYEWVFADRQRRLHALLVVTIVAAILMFVGLVNFFNHGIYPFQQSKLLFITGIIYFYKGLRTSDISFNVVLGAGLLVAGWLYHLNLIILYVLVFPILLLSVLLFARSVKAKIQMMVILVGFPLLLTLPAVIFSGNSFIRYKEPPPKVYTGVIKKTKPLTFWQRIEKRVDLVVQWIKQGRQKEAYFNRIISYEIPLIVLLVFFSTKIRYNRKGLDVCIIVLLFLMMFFHSLTILPRQALLSVYRSGPFFMLLDIVRSTTQSKGVYLTDPYTALYLRVLSGAKVSVLNDLQQTLLFSPLVTSDDVGPFNSDLAPLKDKTIVFNGRFNGRKAVSCLIDGKQGSHSQLTDNMEKWIEENNYQVLPSIFSTVSKCFLEQVIAPILIFNGFDKMIADKYLPIEYDTPSIYRDASVVSFHNITAGDTVKIRFLFRGDSIKRLVASRDNDFLIMLKSDDPDPASRYSKNIREQIVEIKWLKDMASKKLFFLASGYGHFGGLGTIESVSVVHDKQGSK